MPQVHFVTSKDAALSTASKKIFHASDDSATILGGHLVAEALLYRYIQTRVPNPKILDDNQWTFHQSLMLARSLIKHQDNDIWLWNTLSCLNRIRNRLVHDIDIGDLTVRLEELYQTAGDRITIHAPGADPEEREAKKLKYFLIILCGVVRGLQDRS